jgi:hypothetical protein
LISTNTYVALEWYHLVVIVKRYAILQRNETV